MPGTISPVSLFQSTLPLRGATLDVEARIVRERYFNPRSPCGERLNSDAAANAWWTFQSTLPLRGATKVADERAAERINFNPRSPCGERPAPPFASARPCRHFNPRSPCGERRVPVKASSTATGISIHAPLAGSDAVRQAIVDRVGISIHAPLAGSDPAGRPEIRRARFQSTLPLRGATHGFSIGQIQFPHFNPRSPCGERLVPRVCNAIIRIFQSTLPLRGAT